MVVTFCCIISKFDLTFQFDISNIVFIVGEVVSFFMYVKNKVFQSYRAGGDRE